MAEIKMLEKKWMERFAKNLARAMKEAEMSQAELSRLSGVSPATINRYLTGERSPKMYHVCEIADALKVSTDDLLGVNCDF